MKRKEEKELGMVIQDTLIPERHKSGGSGRREHATWDPRRPMYEELSLHPPPGRRIPPGGPLPPHNSQDTLRSAIDKNM
ncbi:hypothetical protein E2C01_018975 [Portunus trituberculatus]|uniref:Uncharacterized protein n=1 Tax=Portunus trituberculatus TaxID=210409 RepID=A0A5B7DVZ9_PORTR|nr:hypothetical protein [Portunus trituberculatus]